MLGYPFEVVRLSAYWNRIEVEPGHCDTSELDWQLDAAERAGKQVIVCLGPVKSFGYPEYFVPDHRLAAPLPEGSLIAPATHPALLAAGHRPRHAPGRAVQGQSRHRRLAGGTRGGRPARSRALLAPVRRLRRRRSRGGTSRRPGKAGHDERVPAHLDPGPSDAVVALQGPGGLPGRGPAPHRHRRHRLLPPPCRRRERPLGPVPGRQRPPGAAAPVDGDSPLGRRGTRAPRADRRRPGRALGGGHHAARSARPCDVQLPAAAAHPHLQPLHARVPPRRARTRGPTSSGAPNTGCCASSTGTPVTSRPSPVSWTVPGMPGADGRAGDVWSQVVMTAFVEPRPGGTTDAWRRYRVDVPVALVVTAAQVGLTYLAARHHGGGTSRSRRAGTPFSSRAGSRSSGDGASSPRFSP